MGGTTRTLAYLYDRNGIRTPITHPDGTWFSTSYDGLNRPWLFTANGATVGYQGFYPHGGIGDRVLANGASLHLVYDGLQRPYSQTLGAAGTAADATWSWGFNAAGQIASVARDNDAYAWTGAYTVNRAYTTNGLNQYSAAGSTALGYDANGNLTSETPPSPAPAVTYSYDVENRLVGRSGGVTLAYDPLGRLFSVSSPSTYTRFLYDGDALVAEYNTAGEMTRRYVHDAGADVPLVSYAGSNLAQPSWLHADRQGSIVLITDGAAAGAINSYDEYGIPGSTNTGRFQYTGQIWLDEIGMYHYKARVYSPTLGRFLQTDPIGYQDQFNLYAYVGNDPVNRTDPTGMCFRVNGTTRYVGLCPMSGEVEGTFVEGLLRDREMARFNIQAARAGRGVFVRFSDMTIGSDDSPSVPVPGEKVEVEPGGERRIFVNINRNYRATVFGRDQRSGRAYDQVNTPEENAAHGILGHAKDEVLNRNTGEVSSLEAENKWRQRHGPDRNFRREGHGGRGETRHNNDGCSHTRLCPR